MNHRAHALALALTLALALVAAPAQAGSYTQFDDVGELTSHIASGGVAKDGITAMTNPLSVSPGEVSYVQEHELVLGVYMNGIAKAYPENLGWRHEIINDEIGGEFISVTLCPLTGTGQVFNATDTDGSQFEFGVSGLLINSNLVMYDRRDNETLYPQMIYTAINGVDKGSQLELLPVIETTWKMWKRMYPDTQVAAGGTGLERYSSSVQNSFSSDGPYTSYPYRRTSNGEAVDYRTFNEWLLFAPSTAGRVSSFDDLDQRFPIKDIVLGICHNDLTRAYGFVAMPEQAIINDQIDDLPLLVVFDRNSSTAIPYSRDAMGQELTFYQVESESNLPIEFMDVETRSRWNMLGVAVDGPLEGEQLRQLPAYNSMWFAWSSYWPETDLWNGEGIIDEPVVTAIEEQTVAALPQSFVLQQNYPNPFNPNTRIQYNLPTAGQVHLTIYTPLGQKIRILVDEVQSPGLYLQSWDGLDNLGRSVASGTYLYHLEMPEQGLRQSRTMSLVS
jgi:hypothetical protein